MGLTWWDDLGWMSGMHQVVLSLPPSAGQGGKKVTWKKVSSPLSSQFLALIVEQTPCGPEYPSGQFESAVAALSPPKIFSTAGVGQWGML